MPATNALTGKREPAPWGADAGAAPPGSTVASHSENGSGRRKPHLSTKHRAALKLQGRYMGTMRGLSPSPMWRLFQNNNLPQAASAAVAISEYMPTFTFKPRFSCLVIPSLIAP